MPNVVVDQAKLVMNAFAATFQNNLVSKDIVSWKKFDKDFNQRNALNVSEQVGPRYTVSRTTDGVEDLTTGVQDSVFGSEQFQIRDVFGSSMGFGDFQMIRDIDDARESEAIKNAACNMAEQIDSYIMRVATLASNNALGDGTVPINNYNDFVSGYTRLKEEGVGDNDLKSVLSYTDKQTLGDTVINYPGVDGLSANTFRKAFTGEIAGIPTMFSQQLPTLTTGTRSATNGRINGAAQNVDYRQVAISPAPGQYNSQTISIDGLAATATVKAGETFTIAGVEAYDNRAQAGLGRPQEFTVLEDATAVGGSIAELRIFPALVAAGTGTGGDVAVNTANACIVAPPANDAAITFAGAPNTVLRPRLLIQKDAIVVNTANLIMPATGKSEMKALTKVPLSVRMWQNSDFDTGEHTVRFDVALTANVRDRRRIVRINGA